MKKCNVCNTELNDNDVVCTQCGASIEKKVYNEMVQVNSSNYNKVEDGTKGKFKYKSISYVFIAVFVCIALIGYVWFTNPKQSISRAVAEGDYETAMNIITDKNVSSDSLAVMEPFLLKITELNEGYMSGALSYETVIENLRNIESLNISSIDEFLESAISEIEKVNSSSESFETAEALFDSGDYMTSLTYYSAVAKEDSNYETSQNKIKAAKENVVADINVKIENADFDNAINNINDLASIFGEDTDVIKLRNTYQSAVSTYELMTQVKPIEKTNNVYISGGDDHTVGLRADGTVIAAGDNNYGQCNVSHWRDIVSVAGGEDHTVGLTSSGTAIAVGRNNYGQCNVSNIDGITAISAGYDHTVLLMDDGTVIAVGNNSKGQCNVSNWSNIIAVCAGNYHTVGLKDDGTVVLAGNSYNVSSWNDIVAVAAGLDYTIGLKSDGTVVAKGNNDSGQCNVGDWSDIVEISAGEDHTVGLMSNGAVVAVGYNTYQQCNVSSWRNVVHITAGEDHTVGIMEDGTVKSLGYNGFGQCDTTSWLSMRTD